jgi:hypothetical protein
VQKKNLTQKNGKVNQGGKKKGVKGGKWKTKTTENIPNALRTISATSYLQAPYNVHCHNPV